ncbi:iron ABC transporter permease [Candidatus Bathyarchaeota archaeon]|nr:iron ABC transporter permease [Candidatus Bathyarchaeota archaeon]
MPKQGAIGALGNLSSKRSAKYGMYLTAVIVLFALIILPPILGIALKWGSIAYVLGRRDLLSRSLIAVQNSFTIALLVSALGVIAGIPLAWVIARSKSKWIKIVDTLADIPFIVPTSVLGYSLLLFWSLPEGLSSLFESSIVSPGWLLIMLLHFTFSYPVIVRVVVGALLDYKREYENAARTLGAPPFVAARTVTFSVIKPSLIAAFILAFARSISETGATFIVAGAFENGPVFIQHMKESLSQGAITQAEYDGATVFTSFMLIIVALLIFLVIRIVGPKLKLPVKKIYPAVEGKLSYTKACLSRNIVTLLVFFLIVLVPSLFVARTAFSAILTDTFAESVSGSGIWGEYWQSLALSYILAGVVTLLNVLIGLPMAILIARKRLGSLFSAVLDLLVNVPLVVPSIALGVSLRGFWKETVAFAPEMLLLIFAHLAITYPYFVKSMSAAVERISIDMEDASRTLGAKPLIVFKTIVLPLTKYSILSGAIMVFTRSVSETGATIAVVSTLKTAPVVLVDWVTHPSQFTASQRGLGSGFLMFFSFLILLALRLAIREKGRY